MDERQREIDRRLKAALWRGRLSQLRRRHYRAIALVIIFFAVAIGFVLWLPKGREHLVRYDYGVVESGFVPGSKRVHAMQLSVLLENGSHIAVELPAHQPYLKGARVKIGMYAFDSDDRGLLKAHFAGYVDENPAPSL